jgi:trehalose synthase-fused probable maltokinase
MPSIADGIPLPEPSSVPLENIEAFLRQQRWFSGKSRTIKRLSVKAAVPFAPYLAIVVEVAYADATVEDYFVPLLAEGSTLADGLGEEACCRKLFSLIENRETIDTAQGALVGKQTSLFSSLRGAAAEIEPIKTASHDQSNSAITLGVRLFLKIFRRVEPGINPDYEIARYLTQQGQFTRFPRLAGAIELQPSVGTTVTLATLQQWIPNQGSAWNAMLSNATAFLKAEAETNQNSAKLLGQRTAELHLALAAETQDPAFATEPMTIDDCEALASRLRRTSQATFQAIQSANTSDPATTVQIQRLLQRGPRLIDHFCDSLAIAPQCRKARVHGDYHLGQVLCQKNDFIILDFEGEPARSLAERRAKDSPLRDVAGMLRSFDYAAYAALFQLAQEDAEVYSRLEPRAQQWQIEASTAYLRGYYSLAAGASFLPQDPRQLTLLRDFFVVEKALYELQYELNNRPAWLRIPLAGILTIADADGKD